MLIKTFPTKIPNMSENAFYVLSFVLSRSFGNLRTGDQEIWFDPGELA